MDDIEDKGDDQFEISDERSVDEVYDALLKNNLQPVMSDYFMCKMKYYLSEMDLKIIAVSNRKLCERPFLEQIGTGLSDETAGNYFA